MPKDAKGRSLSAQSQSSNGFDGKLTHKWVNNSHPHYLLIESDSVISESSIISSQWSGLNGSIPEFLVNNSPSRTHNENVKSTSQGQSNKFKNVLNTLQLVTV